MLKINDRVTTPDGPGTYVGIDLPESRVPRYIVKLDTDKYKFKSGTACYFPDKVKKLQELEKNEK